MESYYNIQVPTLNIDWNYERLLKVTYNSKLKYREIVYKHALHFKREMHYDFPQFNKNEMPWDDDYVEYEAYIFLKNNLNLKSMDDKRTSLAIGSCCFRKRIFKKVTYCWCLDWVWLHPYLRHSNILTENWGKFVKIYDGFYVEEPLSLEMKAFLNKIGWNNDYKKYEKIIT